VTDRPAIWGPEHAAAFDDPKVARRYRFRAPYTDDAIALLRQLVDEGSRDVLDLGAGTGNLARSLAASVQRVDAVEISEVMVEEGRASPGGSSPNIRWIVGPAETAPLNGPYGLAMAGASLHWMDWDVVLPRVAASLTPEAVLAIVDLGDPLQRRPGPVLDAIVRYSVYGSTWRGVDLIGGLVDRKLFDKFGSASFTQEFCQTVDELIDGLHATSSLASWRIGPERSAGFDDEIRRTAPRDADGLVTRVTVTTVTWGRPI
jgi:SAM-dependent methyltransferase